MLEDVVAIARRAGTAITEVYGRTDVGETTKSDASPLTDADLAANAVIVEELGGLGLSYPILSEESRAIPHTEREGWHRYWIVDPLDGTREFLKRNGEFTVNIALVEGGVPVLGVVVAPALGVAYWGARGAGAYRARDNAKAMRVVASRSHAGPLLPHFLERLPTHELVSIGSSLKLCLVADGSAHLYPRFGPTSEWDVGAADAIVREAGGSVCALDGIPLRYNKADVLNPWFVVAGRPPFPWREISDEVLAAQSG